MAKIEVTGMEVEIAKFQKAAQESEAKIKKAVKAGADYLVEKLQEEVSKVAYLDGHLHDSIKADPVKYDSAEGFYSKVEPKGNDPITGEPMAKIGNIVEYGRSNGSMKPQPWMEPTVRRETAQVIAVMDKELSRE